MATPMEVDVAEGEGLMATPTTSTTWTTSGSKPVSDKGPSESKAQPAEAHKGSNSSGLAICYGPGGLSVRAKPRPKLTVKSVESAKMVLQVNETLGSIKITVGKPSPQPAASVVTEGAETLEEFTPRRRFLPSRLAPSHRI